MKLEDVIALSEDDIITKDNSDALKKEYLDLKAKYNEALKIFKSKLLDKFNGDLKTIFEDNSDFTLSESDKELRVKIGAGEIYINIREIGTKSEEYIISKQFLLERNGQRDLFQIELDPSNGFSTVYEKQEYQNSQNLGVSDVLTSKSRDELRRGMASFKSNMVLFGEEIDAEYIICQSYKPITGMINQNAELKPVVERLFSLSSIFK